MRWGRGRPPQWSREARLAGNTKWELIRGFLNTMGGKMGNKMGLPCARIVLKCRNHSPGVAQTGHTKGWTPLGGRMYPTAGREHEADCSEKPNRFFEQFLTSLLLCNQGRSPTTGGEINAIEPICPSVAESQMVASYVDTHPSWLQSGGDPLETDCV